MLEAALLAGYLASMGVVVVSGGDTLVPIYGAMSGGGKANIVYIEEERLEDAAAKGQAWLIGNPDGAGAAALVVDGRVSVGERKLDALLIDFHAYGDEPGFVSLVMPYKPPGDGSPFAVYQPITTDRSDHLKPRFEEVLDAFYEGIERFEKGAVIFERHFDEAFPFPLKQ